MNVCLAVVGSVAVALAAQAEDLSRGLDSWSGRTSHLAVVNPAVPADDGSVLSLRGEWEFSDFRHALEARDLRYHLDKNFWGDDSAAWKNLRKIQVPGCWEAQGVGEPGRGVGMNCKPNSSGIELRHAHIGNGFYRKRVTIPQSWEGKRVWLKVGQARTWAWAWIDDKPVAHFSEAHRALKWDVTDLVTPGKPSVIKFQVDNSYTGYRNSQTLSFHRWGGLTRDVELEATPAECFIDDAWVRGDFDGRKAEVKVKVEGQERMDGLVLRATVAGEKSEMTLSSSASTYNLNLALRAFRPWSPEHPNLYTAKVELVSADGTVLQTRYERFGVRKLEVRGKEFYLNERPFFFRGFGDDHTYPMTGMSPASRESHLVHFRRVRAAGFNFVRTHTHCELPEYFEAADEAGILVQPELSYNCDESSVETFPFDPIGDAKAIWQGYRRYPSFAVYSGGNEGTLGNAGKALFDWVHANDPDRLVIEQDGGTYFEGHRADKSDYASGPMDMWERGSFNKRAFICHEYANLAVKGDARMEDDYTGVWMPRMTRAMRRTNLKPAGLGDVWGDRLQDAQHDFQRMWAIRSVEAARKDPFCDGYIFWTIVDYTHFDKKANAPNCQGLWDPFWRTKPHGTSPEDMAVVNSESAILLDTENRVRTYREDEDPMLFCGVYRRLVIDETNRVYASGEKIPAEFILAHYGEDVRDVRLVWTLAADGKTLATSSHPLGEVAAGPAHAVAKDFIEIPPITKPVKATLAATITSQTHQTLQTSQTCSNTWTFWLFPHEEKPAVPNGVIVADYGTTEAEVARTAGKNLLLIGNRKGVRDIHPGWWSVGWRAEKTSQNGLASVPHPLFGDFPFEPFLSPLLFRIIGQGTPLPVAGFVEKDFVMVGEGIDDFKLYLAAKTRADGGREVFVSGLDIFADVPEARTLLKGILDFLETPSVGAPQTSVRPKIKVACIGDSITWGYAMTNRTVECYPAQLQRLLGDGYEVRNFGVPGAGAYAELKKGEYSHDIPWRSKPLAAEAYSFDPDVVISAFGANDAAYWMWEYLPGPDGRTRLPTGLFRKDYLDLLRGFEKNGRKPRYLLWTRLAPLGKAHRSYGKPNFFLMERDLESVADAVGAEKLDMYTPLLPFCETAHYVKDGVHPEGGAQRVIAETTARQILSDFVWVKLRVRGGER